MTTDRASTVASRPAAALSRGTRSALNAFAVLLIFTLFAGQFWRNFIGWAGFGVLAGLLAIGSVVWIVVLRPKISFHRLPKSLLAFWALIILSLAWSFYPGATALGLVAQLLATAAGVFLALCFTWAQFLKVLGQALRWIIGLSLVFELIVSVFVRHSILPFWVSYEGKIPDAFYWSRDLLFHGGQIQGIVANSNLLAMYALLALIVFAVQLADRTVRRGWGIGWLVAAAITFILSRSSTVIVATLVTAVVLLFALWTRSRDPEKRAPVYLTAIAAIVLAVIAAIALWAPIVRLFGKSEDLTGRLTIWHAVTDLAVQRPVFGWGWISYWAPWVKPFTDLADRKGVTYLQAHNAWLDVWLQVGIVGLIIFVFLVLSTLSRSWFAAVDRPRTSLRDTDRFNATALLPLLLMAALIAQSAAESRLLVEGGWALLVVIAMKTRADRP
jgi:O-antigen ligase